MYVLVAMISLVRLKCCQAYSVPEIDDIRGHQTMQLALVVPWEGASKLFTNQALLHASLNT